MQDLASFLEVIKNLIGLVAALVFLAGVTWLVVKVIGGRHGKKPSTKGQSEEDMTLMRDLRGPLLSILGSLIGGLVTFCCGGLGFQGGPRAPEPEQRVVDKSTGFGGSNPVGIPGSGGTAQVPLPPVKAPDPPWAERVAAPFYEDFQAVKEGELPKGWSGDDAIGVRRGDKLSWLQASTDKRCRVSTPFLQFPTDFELEVLIGRSRHKGPYEMFDQCANLKIRLEGDQGTIDLPIDIRFNDDWFLSPGLNPPIRFMDKKGGWNGEYLQGQSNRFRLIREGNTYRCIIRDQVVVEHNLPGKQEYRRVSFQFGEPEHLFQDAGARQLEVYGVSLIPLSRVESKQPFTPLAEDFRSVKEGELPKGWSGSSALGVRRNQTMSWLELSADTTFQSFTPPTAFPANFNLEVWASLPSDYFSNARLQLALEGRRNTPDLKMDFKYEPGWNFYVQFTNAVRQELPHKKNTRDDSPKRIQLIRDGETYHLIVNDKKVIVQRMPKHQEFGRLAFVGSGGRDRARIFSVSLSPYTPGDEKKPPEFNAALTGTVLIKNAVVIGSGVEAFVCVDKNWDAGKLWPVGTATIEVTAGIGTRVIDVYTKRPKVQLIETFKVQVEPNTQTVVKMAK